MTNYATTSMCRNCKKKIYLVPKSWDGPYWVHVHSDLVGCIDGAIGTDYPEAEPNE